MNFEFTNSTGITYNFHIPNHPHPKRIGVMESYGKKAAAGTFQVSNTKLISIDNSGIKITDDVVTFFFRALKQINFI